MRTNNRLYIFHFEKLTSRPGAYLNSPPITAWSYCGSFRAKTRAEAEKIAAYKVGSSLVRVMPEFQEEDKGYL